MQHLLSHAVHLAAATQWEHDAIAAVNASQLPQPERERLLFVVRSTNVPQPAAVINRDHRGAAIANEEWCAAVRWHVLHREHTQARVGDAIRSVPQCPLCGAETGIRGIHEATHGCNGSSAMTKNHNAAQRAIIDALSSGLGSDATVSAEPVLGALHNIGGMKPDAPNGDIRADILVRSNTNHADFVLVDLVIACPVGNNRQAAADEDGVAAAAAEQRKKRHYARFLNKPDVVVPWAMEPGGRHGKLGIKALVEMVKLAKRAAGDVAPLPARGISSGRCLSVFYDVLQRVNCALWRSVGRDILRQREALRHSARHNFLHLRREHEQFVIRPGQQQRSAAAATALRLPNTAAARAAVAG
jgi:hypothetical protein